MKWVKTYTLVAVIAVFAVAQIPQDVFGLASDGQKTNLINSVCEGTDANDLKNAIDLTNEAKSYCKAYFQSFLSGASDVEHISNLSSSDISRIKQHVNWWGNAKNQEGRAENDWRSFLSNYCEFVEGESVGFYNSAATGGYFCVYNNNNKMINPYCAVITKNESDHSGGSWVSERTVTCYASEKEAENIIDMESNEDIVSGSGSEGDDCSQGSSLGWIFCPLANTVSDLIDGIIDWFLVPMLQWRILIP